MDSLDVAINRALYVPDSDSSVDDLIWNAFHEISSIPDLPANFSLGASTDFVDSLDSDINRRLYVPDTDSSMDLFITRSFRRLDES